MQIETSKEGRIKLGELPELINAEFKNCIALGRDAAQSGQAAIKAAIRAGEYLGKAKRAVGHGKWLKWLADSCPDISDETARRWMALSNSSHGRNLADAKNITDAYKRIGIIPESEREKKGIGTAPVDIFAELVAKFNRLGPVIDITADINPDDIPHSQRQALITKAQPMIEFVERVKAAEGV